MPRQRSASFTTGVSVPAPEAINRGSYMNCRTSATSLVPTTNRFLRYRVTSQTYPIRHPRHCKVRAWQPEKDQVALISSPNQDANSRAEGPTRECCLKAVTARGPAAASRGACRLVTRSAGMIAGHGGVGSPPREPGGRHSPLEPRETRQRRQDRGSRRCCPWRNVRRTCSAEPG